MNTSPEYLAEQGLSDNFPKRFISKVSIGDGCWEWQACKDPNGYGIIHSIGHTGSVFAHRASYVLFVGPIPDGLDICHDCDNPGCVNPKHLFPGTALDNLGDCARKGRTCLGERSGHAKLTWVKVAEIRNRAANKETQASIAALFGVKQQCVSKIVLNKRWLLKHAPK